jgi:hypothetical protein
VDQRANVSEVHDNDDYGAVPQRRVIGVVSWDEGGFWSAAFQEATTRTASLREAMGLVEERVAASISWRRKPEESVWTANVMALPYSCD